MSTSSLIPNARWILLPPWSLALRGASGITTDFPPTDLKPAGQLCGLLHAVTPYQPDWAPRGFYGRPSCGPSGQQSCRDAENTAFCSLPDCRGCRLDVVSGAVHFRISRRSQVPRWFEMPNVPSELHWAHILQSNTK